MKYLIKILWNYKDRNTLFERESGGINLSISPIFLFLSFLWIWGLCGTYLKNIIVNLWPGCQQEVPKNIIALLNLSLFNLFFSLSLYCVCLHIIFFFLLVSALKLIIVGCGHLIAIISKNYLGKFLTRWLLGVGYRCTVLNATGIKFKKIFSFNLLNSSRVKVPFQHKHLLTYRTWSQWCRSSLKVLTPPRSDLYR